MEVKDLMDKAMEKHARTIVREWFHGEMEETISETLYDTVDQWLKNNKARIEKMIDEEMKKALPRFVKSYTKDILDSLR